MGKDTFARSLQSLALLRHLVNFGQSSGPVEPFAPSQLSVGFYTVTRPMIVHYIADRVRLERCASEPCRGLEASFIELALAI